MYRLPGHLQVADPTLQLVSSPFPRDSAHLHWTLVMAKAQDPRPRGPYKRGGEKGAQRAGSSHVEFLGARSKAYLEELARTGIHSDARGAAGNVTVHTVAHTRAKNPEFAEAEIEALEKYNATLEKEIHRRAVEGYDKPVFYRDTVVGYVRVYSDSLLLAKAKRHIAEYRDHVTVDQNTNVRGGVAVGLADLDKLSPVGRKMLRDLIAAEGSSEDAGKQGTPEGS